MENQIRFVFTPTKEDYTKALRLFYIQKKSYRVLGIILILVALSGLFTLFFGDPSGLSISAVAFLFLPIFFLVYLYYINPMQVGRQVQKSARLQAETTWQVSNAEISITTEFSETQFDWGTFGDFVETKDYFLITYSTNQRMFQIVPKRAFASTEQMDIFCNLLEDNITVDQQTSQKTFLARYGKTVLYLIVLLAIIFFVVYGFQQGATAY